MQSGDLKLELIELFSDAPSAFYDMFPNGQPASITSPFLQMITSATGIAWLPWDAGHERVQRHFRPQVCDFDAREATGHMIEIYPPSEKAFLIGSNKHGWPLRTETENR